MTVLKSSHAASSRARSFDFDRAAMVGSTVPTPLEGSLSHVTANPASPSNIDEKALSDNRIAALETELVQARQEVAKAREQALVEGHKQGEAAAVSRDTEKLEVLRRAIEDTQQAISASLRENQDAGIALARAILARVLGADTGVSDMVSATAAHWHKQLSQTPIVRLRVSPDDFPDQGVLEELGARCAGLDVVTDGALKQGGCTFDLALGSLDAALPVQLAAADSFLARHASPKAVDHD